MGEAEVVTWLTNQRAKGIHEFFTVQQIEKGLKDMGCTNGQLKKVGHNCLRLNLFGILEYRGKMVGTFKHRKYFRIKKSSMRDHKGAKNL